MARGLDCIEHEESPPHQASSRNSEHTEPHADAHNPNVTSIYHCDNVGAYTGYLLKLVILKYRKKLVSVRINSFAKSIGSIDTAIQHYNSGNFG